MGRMYAWGLLLRRFERSPERQVAFCQAPRSDVMHGQRTQQFKQRLEGKGGHLFDIRQLEALFHRQLVYGAGQALYAVERAPNLAGDLDGLQGAHRAAGQTSLAMGSCSMTAGGEGHATEQVREAHVNGVVKRPFEAPALVQDVFDVLRGLAEARQLLLDISTLKCDLVDQLQSAARRFEHPNTRRSFGTASRGSTVRIDQQNSPAADSGMHAARTSFNKEGSTCTISLSAMVLP